MKLVYLGAISTGIVLILGMAMVVPAFMFPTSWEDGKLKVLIQIEIKENSNLPYWCADFGEKLDQDPIKLAVFLTGQIAESYPECIFLVEGVDIGSQGYQYNHIPEISDYLKQLSQIQKGKRVIDAYGGFDSKIFKAPYGATDQNIYSLLSRSGIVADFSNEEQYNLYLDGQFVKNELLTIKNTIDLESKNGSKIVTFSFSNSESVISIFNTIDEIRKYDVQFVNPSDLYGKPLTNRVQ